MKTKEIDYKAEDKKTLKKLYKDICSIEDLKPIKLYFGRVGKGGAVCGFYGRTPIYIKIDLDSIQIGSVYALCHEVAHQIQISRNGNATHNRKFKAEEKRLLKRYENCLLARQLYW